MTVDAFYRWLVAHGRAWEERDPEAEVPLRPEDIRFTFDVMALNGDTGLAHWRTTLVRKADGARIRLDGVLTATFDSSGRCRHFREWWYRQEG